MRNIWLPNGTMKDGTLIFGPCKTRPDVSGSIHEINVDGKVWFVALCCDKPTITDVEREELVNFCQMMVR